MTFVEKLRELEKGATEGPWEPFDEEDETIIWGGGRKHVADVWIGRDARLIAFLRNTAAEVAELVEAVERHDESFDMDKALDALDRKVQELEK